MNTKLESKKALIRFYDSSNLGDDLFLKILGESLPEVEFDLPSYNNTALDIPSNISKLKLILPRKLFAAIGLAINIANPQLLILSLIRRYDAVIYIGGSIFIESKYHRKWTAEKNFYKRLKTPYYIIGANIGPFHTERFVNTVRSILSRSADTCLRDSYSYNLVKDLSNTRLSTDVAFSLNVSPYDMKSTKTAIISVIDSYRKFDNTTAEAYDGAIRKLTKKLIDDGYAVIYMSFCEDEGDVLASRRIAAGLEDGLQNHIQEFIYKGNLEESLRLIASSSIVVGTRFHANILGLVFNKKILPMAYSNKTLDILKDINYSGPVIDIRKLEDFNLESIHFEELPVIDIEYQRREAAAQFSVLKNSLYGG